MSEQMECPKCHYLSHTQTESCPRCGVIFAKYNRAGRDIHPATAMPLNELKDVQLTSNPTPWIKIALMALLLLFGLSEFRSYRGEKNRLKMIRDIGVNPVDPAIKIYGADNDFSKSMEWAMRLRSSNVEFIKFTSYEQIQQNTELFVRLKDVGLVRRGKIYLPAVELNGELLTQKEVEILKFESNAKYYKPEHDEPYIVVYGVNGCSYTQAVIDGLKAKNISFEYRDMNASRLVALNAEVRMYATGYREKAFTTPIIDVNGYVRPQMKLGEILTKFAAR